jgi:hypothetical protein
MTRYRRKPEYVEAVRFDPSGPHKMELPAGVRGVPSPGADNWDYMGCHFWIDSWSGRIDVNPGDWIVTDSEGERNALPDEKFEALYDLAD